MRSVLPILCLSLCNVLCLSLCNVAVSSDLEPFVLDLDELDWGPPSGGNGFPVGIRTATVRDDPVSGGRTYFAMFPAGTHLALHWHTHDEFVVVVSGSPSVRIDDEDHDLAVGSYVVIPGKRVHSWTIPERGDGAVILVRRVGPSDFHFVED